MTILQLPGFPFGQLWADSSSVVTSVTNYDMWTRGTFVFTGFNPSSNQSEGWVVKFTVTPLSTL